MIVICDPDPAFRSRVAAAAGEPSVTHEAARTDDALEVVGVHPDAIDAVVCGPSAPRREVLDLASALRRDAPQIGVVVVAAKASAPFLRAALRAGVRDVLDASFGPAELRAALGRAEAFARRLRGQPAAAVPEDGRGTLVTVFSSKGGAGKSFVASNVGSVLSRSGEDVALVDLDLECGDLAIMLGLHPRRTIFDAAQSLEHLDPSALKSVLQRRGEHLHLLAAPPEPGLSEKVTSEAVRQIVDMLRAEFPFVVVDGPGTFTDQLLACLDASDRLVLVSSLDVPSIKNLKLALQTIEVLGFPAERVVVALNRVAADVGLRPSEVAKALGRRIDVELPSSREVIVSVNRGVPVAEYAPSSPVAAALGQLAAMATGRSVAPASASKPGFLERLVSR